MRKTLAITCGASALIISLSHADVVETYELGTGDSTSSFVFQFTNGNQYMYEVSYDAPMTGQSVIEFIMDSQVDYFVADIVSYSFGDSLNGLAIGDDFDEGFGTPPDYLDYWHYWVKEDVLLGFPSVTPTSPRLPHPTGPRGSSQSPFAALTTHL
jgi:hypothetical protein